MKKFNNKWVWITGASSGIGYALTEKLLSMGAKCIISARSEKALNELQSQYTDNCHVVVTDISDKNKLLEAKASIEKLTQQLDYVILNAGTCEYVDVNQFESELFERVITTNVMGTVQCLEIILPLLQRSKHPLLAIVSSSATYLPFPRTEAYGASKAALSYLARSLRVDLAPFDIDVTVIEPGFVKTPLTDKNDFAMPMRISAEDAAEEIIAGLEKRKLTIHFPKRFTRVLKFFASLPESWQLALMKKLKK